MFPFPGLIFLSAHRPLPTESLCSTMSATSGAVSAPSSSSLAGKGPIFSIDTFIGVWKRALQSRLLGTFMPSKDVSDIVVVDRMPDADADALAPAKAGARRTRFRWNFGKTIESVRLGYTVEVLEPPGGGSSGGGGGASASSAAAAAAAAGGASSSSSPSAAAPPSSSAAASSSDPVQLRVVKNGRACYGMFQPDLGVLTIHLLGIDGNNTIVYKALDEDTMAVSVTQVPSSNSPPIVQYGFLFRVVVS